MTTVTASRGRSIDLDDPTFQTTPWPIYAHFRRDEPVHLAADGSWYVFRHDAVRQVLAAAELGADHPFRTTRRAFGPSMVDRDGEAHQRLRGIAAPALRPKLVDDYETTVIEPVVHDLLDRLDGRDVVDLAADFAMKVPVRVFCAVMGLPRDDSDWLYAALRPLIDHIDQAGVSLAKVTARRAVLRGYFQRKIAEGSHGPGLVRLFAEAGGATTEADVLNNLMLLLAAGTETTGLAISNVLASLLRQARRYDELREDRTLVPAAIAESLRLEPPLHFVTRFPTADVTVDGVTLPAGVSVQACLASANRDERRYDAPDVWDPRREDGSPITFGLGRHRCLGFGLANRELEVVLRAMLDRGFMLRPVGGSVPPARGRSFRGVRRLLIHLDGPRATGAS